MNSCTPPHALLYKDGHMLGSDGQTDERERTARAGQSAGGHHTKDDRYATSFSISHLTCLATSDSSNVFPVQGPP